MKIDFDKISRNYDKVHGDTVNAIHRFSQENYYSRCKSAKVLDIGNGGQPATEVMGKKFSQTLKNFVAVDNNFDMLVRKKCDFQRVVGDGMHLPFGDDSFDYVLINGVFHHLGFLSKKDQITSVSNLLNEARRVCTREILIYEIFVSQWLETCERWYALTSGHMPAFVLSQETFSSIAIMNEMSVRELTKKSLSNLMGGFYFYPILMAYEWLKIPAFVNPLQHSFFVLSAK